MEWLSSVVLRLVDEEDAARAESAILDAEYVRAKSAAQEADARLEAIRDALKALRALCEVQDTTEVPL